LSEPGGPLPTYIRRMCIRMKFQRPKFQRLCVTIFVFASLLVLSIWLFTVPMPIPVQISDTEFRRMVLDFSEAGGSFYWDNIVSNELPFQHVIPKIKQKIQPGGVYLGVGPEQNFTYLAAFEPRIAFIIDIRRQNMLEHLLYKAVFEMAADRADFVSILFCRKRPAGLTAETPVASLFRAFNPVMPDRQLFEHNLKTIADVLIKVHQFPLTADDLANISRVYKAFFTGGPALDYGVDVRPGTGTPTYEALMNATDQLGRTWSYLASESGYRKVRRMEQRNLVVPVTGDFAGRTALRRVGRYLDDHRMIVNVFYVSNVEQYLFRRDDWSRFYENVAALPLDSSSTFIRSVTSDAFSGIATMGFASLFGSMTQMIDTFHEGHISKYHDIVEMSSR
jgi:hypothetical protein